MTDTAVAVRQEAPAPVAASETAAIFSLVERMATDPTISIERVEQTFSFYQKVKADRARDAFLAAFAALQAGLPAVERKGTGHNSKKYARFEDFVEAIRPKLTEHGFSLAHRIEQPNDKVVVITAVLGHRDGHDERTSITLPLDVSGGKLPVHATASSISYGKRYTGFAILGVASEDEDDDGKAAGAGATIDEEQEKTLRDKIEAFKANIPRFCKFFKIEKLPDLPAARYGEAIKMLEAKK